MKRRTFVIAGLGATGALLIGWSLRPPRQRLRGRTPVPTGNGEVALNGWVKIAPDETITVIVPKAEMGQGITTAAAMLLAEELDADWTRIRVEHGPIDAIYNNIAAMVDGMPFHPDDQGRVARTTRWFVAKVMREQGFLLTGGSSSMKDLWGPLRDAGAMARLALVGAAAQRWGVPAETCRTAPGAVVLNDRRLTYGALLGTALEHLPTSWTLKDPSEYRLVGQPMPRLDAAAKSNGTAVFGVDAAPTNAAYAAVAWPPRLGATVAGFDAAATRARPGVRAVLSLAGGRWGNRPGVAVVADTWWHAQQALAHLNVRWQDGPAADFSSVEAMRTLETRATQGQGYAFRSEGDLIPAFKRASFSVEATYRAPYLAHATMEPPNATVRVSEGGIEVWTGTQVPGVARRAVAEVCGVDEGRVVFHQTLLGGGFGRRLVCDYVASAAEIAKAMPGTAVQLLFSREDDLRSGPFRPMTVAKLQGALDGDGTLVALSSSSAGQSPIKGWGAWIHQLGIGVGPDKATVEGLGDQPYEIPTIRVTHDTVDLPVPVGSWRGVGHSHTAFFLESFLDECAAIKQVDPLAYRLRLLANHPRAARVLSLAAEQAGWGDQIAGPAGGGRSGRGIALHWSFGALVAHVVEVDIPPDGASWRVRRVVCAADCGFVVNPDGVRQQLESGILFGLTAVHHGEVTFEKGAAVPSNFHDYRPLRMRDVPVIEIHLVPGGDTPEGIGEPGLPPVAPAVANAIYAATGKRLRSLPLRLSEA